jgi:DNA-binding NarL/FixJ family response regulator
VARNRGSFREVPSCIASYIGVGSSAKVVFLAVHSEKEFLEACMTAGASGYVLKSSLKTHLIPAIDAALEGRIYISQFVP